MTAMLFPSHVFRAWQRSHAMHDSSPPSLHATWAFFSVLENDRLKIVHNARSLPSRATLASPPSRCGRKFAKLLQLPARTAAVRPRANRKPFRRASRTARAKRPHIRPSWIYAVATAKPIGTKGTAMKTLEEMFPDQNVGTRSSSWPDGGAPERATRRILKDHNCSAAPEDVGGW
mgnify:CR=1 FL=1